MANETWQVDGAHSAVNLTVRHMVISKVRGKFTTYTATLELDEDDLTRSQIDVSIDAASIDTGVADRDKPLRSADFFDVERFPELTFKSTRVGGKGDELELVGDLTIHGVTREVALKVEATGRARDPWGNERAGFTAKTAIERKEFGLTWNQLLEAGGVVVGDRINIELEVEAVRQVVAKAA